jgi:hypothetical protein
MSSGQMNEKIHPTMAGRIRVAGALILLGMAVEAFSLLWSNPTAFLLFLGFGGAAMGAGVLLFLYSLVSVPQETTSE